MRWGTLAPAPPTRPPRLLTQRERPTWDPLSSDGAVPAPRCRGPPFPMPLGRPAPHLSRPLPLGPRRAWQRRLGERWEACISLRGADGGGTRKAERPAPRAPFQASNTRLGRWNAEQYSAAWLLLRDHPSTCPLPLLGPALQPLPRAPAAPGPAGPTLATASARGHRLYTRPSQLLSEVLGSRPLPSPPRSKAGTREEEADGGSG